MASRLASLLLAVAAASCSPAPPSSAIDRLHECGIDEGPSGAYCGTFEVPENRVTRKGRRIPLKIVVAPALRRDAASEPLCVL